MQLSTIRTKYFPVIFLVAGLVFACLFAMFYNLVFEAIDDILHQQNRRILTTLATEIESCYGDFERETKLLYASRGVQRNMALLTEGEWPDKIPTFLDNYVASWHKQVESEVYRSITYLDEDIQIVNSFDLSFGSQSDVRLDESAALESNEVADGASLARNFSADKAVVRSLEQELEVDFKARAIVLSDSTEVLRNIRRISHRKTGDVIGLTAIDLKLESVFSWTPEVGRELLILDSTTRKIVFDSANPQWSGLTATKLYPSLLQALGKIVSRKQDNPEKFVVASNQYLVSVMKMEVPQWTVAVIVDLDSYMSEHESKGFSLIVASLMFLAIGGASIYALTMRVRRRTDELIRANRVVTEHNQMLEDELETAHDLQMSLMPQHNPHVRGIDIFGLCRPATNVGGDLYQYFFLPGEHVAIVLADVTGHGMKAAVPTMVLSGLLDNQIEYTPKPDDLMCRLNNSLYRVLESRTFVCFSIAEFDPQSRRVQLANGGCPYPYLYRCATDNVEEVELVGFPLGLRPNSSYGVIDFVLGENDLIVMCSDGIIEAVDSDDEMFGFERTAAVIRQAGIDRISSEEVVSRLFEEVERFSGVRTQEDDQTMVAIRGVESFEH